MTRIVLDRTNRTLRLTHTTTEGFIGVLIVPFSESAAALATERVFDPNNNIIHQEEIFSHQLCVDLEPHLVGMTRAAQMRRIA